MNVLLPPIYPDQETKKITSFIKEAIRKEKFTNVIIALSGGIDSTTSFYLLKKSLPLENIFVVHLPYFQHSDNFDFLMKLTIMPQKNIFVLPIKKTAGSIASSLALKDNRSDFYKIRMGNIMARVRMIFLYDLAKKQNAMVCGTENKSEYYLGYFTRFGDEASDFEPIRHLYKTHVYQLATYLNVPEKIIQTPPTAGLWQGQTDENELGFSYQEADTVLHLYFDKKHTVESIEKEGLANAKQIISWTNANAYKHHTPYFLA